jgi:hypothetical protein
VTERRQNRLKKSVTLPIVPRRLTYLILTVAGLAALFLAWNAWRNSRSLSDAEMLKRLPTADAVVLSIDFDLIRHSSVYSELMGSKIMEDADYLAFVRDSGFDYKRDLDDVVASFAPAGNFFVVRGRFDWKKLEAFAKQSGGSCYDKLCHMPGSAPDRRISFLPLAAGMMGLAVSTEDLAASQLLHGGTQRPISVPSQPLWLSIPGSALNRTAKNIPGASLVTQTITGVDDVMLTIGANGSEFAAQCRTTQDAANVAGQLKTLTSIFKGAMEREKKKPDPKNLSGVLTAGQFRQSDRMVYGEWTLQKSFLDNLAGDTRQ